MLQIERRGDYDKCDKKDALVVASESGERIAIFVDRYRPHKVQVAVDLPSSSGTRCYAIDFAWLLDHLRHLEPNAAVKPRRHED